MKRAIYVILTAVLFLSFAALRVQAGGSSFETDPNVGLQTITIPFFPQINVIDAEFATTLSWLSFFGNLGILFIIVFWIYRILRAGIKAIRSEGEAEGLQEAWKQVRSVFIGAGATFLVPITLSVVGLGLQVGPVWEWPLAFRECDVNNVEIGLIGLSTDDVDPESIDYYFQALQLFESEREISRDVIDGICFN